MRTIWIAATLGLLAHRSALSRPPSPVEDPRPPAPPVLTRDVDQRTLPQVSLRDLSPAMRKTVVALLHQQPRPESYTLQRIPVAPRGHRLYLLGQSGAAVCAINGPNCPQTVFDETPEQVTTVADFGGVGVAVVRRPGLQMPDIATYEQLGHFATYTTVFRYAEHAWRPYLCKDAPIADAEDPHPEWVAYQRCDP